MQKKEAKESTKKVSRAPKPAAETAAEKEPPREKRVVGVDASTGRVVLEDA